MSNLKLYGDYFKITFWSIIIIETLSFLGHNFSLVNQILFPLIILVTFIISLRKLEYGFWIVVVELFIGSFGYLFSYDTDEFRLSIRLGVFVALILAFIIKSVKDKKVSFYRSKLYKPFVIFVSFVAFGVVVGLVKGNEVRDVFFDFNAYLYFALIFVSYSVLTSWDRINKLLQILFASVSVIAIKTFFLLSYFAHQTNEGLVRLVYTWVRDTRVGEISLIAQDYFRIFFQSHIWSLFAGIICLVLLVALKKNDTDRANRRIIWIVGILSSTALIISFSRSIWLSIFITVLIFFGYMLKKKDLGASVFLKAALVMAVILMLEVVFITGLVNFKLPGGSSNNISTASLIRDRITVTDEPALGSRFQLLNPLWSKVLESPIVGSGFGTTITYKTLDPRTKELNGGQYTTYSFEWGYLDLLVKLGVFGLLAYMFFIWRLLKIGFQSLGRLANKEEYYLVFGLVLSLVSLLVVHFTTPYLNHPLGITLIVLLTAIFEKIFRGDLSVPSIKS